MMKPVSLHSTLFVMAFLLLMVSTAQASSIFSINGPGEFIYTGDARLRAMGGSGLALTEGYSGSLINPALLGGLKLAAVSLSFRPEALYVRDESEQNVLTSVRMDHLALYLPLGKQLAVGLDLRRHSEAKFKIYQETTVFEETYLRSVVGRGGTSLASLVLARRFGSSIQLGVRVGHLFGETTKSWSGVFDDSNYRSTKTTRKIVSSGTQLAGGVAFRIGSRLSLGAVYIAPQDVNQKETRSSSFAPTVKQTNTLEYPPTMGFGLTYRPSGKLLVALDVTATRWSKLKTNEEPAQNFTDVVRISTGCELAARGDASKTSFTGKIPLRLGYALEPWHVKTPDGEKINAHFFTLGIGLPFGRQGAHLDASLELGIRGDVSSAGAEEKIVRGTISLWGFEPWFQRRK